MTSLGAAIAGSLPFLQSQADSAMTDTIVIKEHAGSTLNNTTGVLTPAFTTVYSGKGRVKPLKRVTSGSATAGEARDSELVFIVSVPLTATSIRPGHVVTITESADASLLDITLRVAEVERGSQVTARRLTCELVEPRA